MFHHNRPYFPYRHELLWFDDDQSQDLLALNKKDMDRRMEFATMTCMVFINVNPKTWDELPWWMKHTSLKTWVALLGNPDPAKVLFT